MKTYSIVSSKKVVASFKMDYQTFKMRFDHSGKLVDWIREKHPELNGIPYQTDFKGDLTIINFYSVGDLVIEEL